MDGWNTPTLQEGEHNIVIHNCPLFRISRGEDEIEEKSEDEIAECVGERRRSEIRLLCSKHLDCIRIIISIDRTRGRTLQLIDRTFVSEGIFDKTECSIEKVHDDQIPPSDVTGRRMEVVSDVSNPITHSVTDERRVCECRQICLLENGRGREEERRVGRGMRFEEETCFFYLLWRECDRMDSGLC